MVTAHAVLLISEQAEKAGSVITLLENQACRVQLHINQKDDVVDAVSSAQTDLVVVHTDSPSHFFLNQLYTANQSNPKPIIIFTNEREPSFIQSAIEAGVSSYVVDGLDEYRIGSIINVACSRFKKEQALRSELSKTRSQLEERKVIEKAKGILMQRRKLSEDEAYKTLRKLAMDKNQRLVDVANNVLSVSALLG